MVERFFDIPDRIHRLFEESSSVNNKYWDWNPVHFLDTIKCEYGEGRNPFNVTEDDIKEIDKFLTHVENSFTPETYKVLLEYSDEI